MRKSIRLTTKNKINDYNKKYDKHTLHWIRNMVTEV